MKRLQWLALATGLALGLAFCGGDAGTVPAGAPVATAPAATPTPTPVPPPPDPACVCTPTEPASGDYRHAAKHVDLIVATPQEITVSDVLAWPHSTALPTDAPRSGIELRLFRIAKAYLQTVYICKDDCDLHMELSATPDPAAPRIIVETPIDSSYCPARVKLDAALKAKGFSMTWGTVPSLAVEVTGMAFADYEHVRGTSYVATSWEIHPAVVTLLP